MHKFKLSPSARLLPICAAIVLCIVTFNREAWSQIPTIAGTYSGTVYPGSNGSDPNPEGPLAASVTLNPDGTLANIYIQDLLETFDPDAVQNLQVTSNQDPSGNILDESLYFIYARSSAPPLGWGYYPWINLSVSGEYYDFYAGTWTRKMLFQLVDDRTTWLEEGTLTLNLGGPPPPPAPPPPPNDSTSRKTPPNMQVQEPVDVATGLLTHEETVLAVQGAQRVPFTVSYNGWGWADNYNIVLYDYSGQDPAQHIEIWWPDGRANHYYPLVGTRGTYYSNEISALHDTLHENYDGTYDLVGKDQTRYHFTLIAFNPNSPWIAPTARLDSIINRVGQAISLSYDNAGNPVQVTDSVTGVGLTLAYDDIGAPVSATDPMGRQVKFSYNAWQGYPTCIQVFSPNGQLVKSTTYTYNYGELVSATDMDGRIIMTNTYDSLGRVINQTDGRGGVTLFSYQTNPDGSGATQVTDRNGKITTYKFNSKLLLVERDDPTGYTETWNLDDSGNILSYTNKNGHQTSYAYDSNGNVLSISDPANKVTTMTYDGLNRLTSISDPKGNVTSFSYDQNNNLTQITDPLGAVTTQNWDANSFLTSRQLPRGGIESYLYTGGLLTSRTDANGNTSSFSYDAAGRLVSSQDATQAVTSYGYDGLDHITSITDPLNQTRLFAYNSRGWELSQTDPLGNTTQFQYDANGNLISRIDPSPGGTTSYQYDSEDRLIQRTDALGQSIGFGRDAAGRLISVTDGRGKAQTFQVDGLGHGINAFDAYARPVAQNYYDSRELLEEATDGMGRINNWDYDERGALIQYTDGLSKVTTFSNDALKRLLSATSPLSDVTAQSFDLEGNRVSLTNALANPTAFSFDLGDRLSSVTTANGLSTQYTYNSRNLLETVTRPSGQKTTNTYDAALRLCKVVDSYATTVFNYDANGRLVETDDTSNGGAKTTRSYDALGHLSSYTDEGGNTIGYAYDKVGNLVQLTYPGGQTVSYTYDQNNRLLTVTDWASRVTTYSYDDNGRLVLTTYANGTSESRTYDVSGKLTGITTQDSSGNVLYSCANTIDAAGRVTVESLNALPAALSDVVPVTMSFDADNRLATFNGQTVSFDPDGNLINGPGAAGASTLVGYVYDARNRLSSHNGLSYGYDPEGRRVTVNDMVSTAYYVIDPSAALDRVLVRAKGATQTLYIWGLGLIGEERNGVYSQYHFDARGSTIALTAVTGTVTDQFGYGPYGEALGHTGTSDTPFQFNGQFGIQTDPNGLLYMRARYYNPAIRRFVNQDVLFGNLDPGISLNRFAFANGNPVSLMDPFGLCAQNDQTDAFGNPTTLQGWQQSWDNLATGLNAARAWEQQTNSWLYQKMPWLTYVAYGMNVATKTAEYSLMFVPAAGLAMDALAGIEAGSAAAEGATTAEDLAAAANRAAQTVGPGSGPVYGTQVHTAFQAEVEALGQSGLRTEVSYLNGAEVPYGTPGSVRIDVGQYGANGQIQEVFDLKTGSATLTPARIQQIQQAVGSQVPVTIIRP